MHLKDALMASALQMTHASVSPVSSWLPYGSIAFRNAPKTA